MPADDAGEKTEQPTPRRREEARQKGQVPRSTDLTAAISLLVGLMLLNWFGPTMLERMLDLARDLGHASEPTAAEVQVWVRRAAVAAAGMTLPFLGVLSVLTVVGTLAQTGPVLAWQRAQPRLENINPLKGLKRIFSMDSVTRAVLGVLKLALIAWVAYISIAQNIRPVLGAAALEPMAILHNAGRLIFMLSLRMALILLVLGLIDYAYQRYKNEKSLKMTKQEVKDELKRMDGDPHIKARRRQLQMKLAMQRLSAEVPKADVVVTNPTEYAVALRYDEAAMAAPRLVAKGRGWLAERIRQIAAQHRIAIVQRPALARALYASVEVGEEVPPAYYRAVAEILAYVYQLSGRAVGASG
jgi:flagellar biosynthetic protein FlhB